MTTKNSDISYGAMIDMMLLKYVKGDATNTNTSLGNKAIIHIVNNMGGFGAGFVVALKKWPIVESCYRGWYKNKIWEGVPFKLGEIQPLKIFSDIHVINMLAQNGYSSRSRAAIDYDALESCLIKSNNYALKHSLHLCGPKFGAGLAGGDWKVIEQMILDTLTVPITIYTF